ncbi:hypothetical protein ACIKTA_03970 [Hansschlegelia beijingensis]
MTENEVKALPKAKIRAFSKEVDEFFLVVESADGALHRVSFDNAHSQFLVRVMQDHMERTGSLAEYPRDVRRLTFSVSSEKNEVFMELHTTDDLRHAYAFHQAKEPFQELAALLDRLKQDPIPSD